MCELLGVSANRPERPTYIFRGFLHGSQAGRRARPNPDGWGVACYPDDGRTAAVLKVAEPIHESTAAEPVRRGEFHRSSTHILHIRRRATGGAEPAERNTHPFARSAEGRDYVFAHNGYFKHEVASTWPVGAFGPSGETMSERAFCHLLAEHIGLVRDRRWEELEAVFRELNQAGDANCILSDGEVLVAYRDANGYANLSFVERQAPYRNPIVLTDEEGFRVDLMLSDDESRRAVLIATRPLTAGEGWAELPRGRVVVLAGGHFARLPS